MDFKEDYTLDGDDIILLATSEPELQELVYRLDRVGRKYSYTHQRWQDQGIGDRRHSIEQLEQVDTFPYVGSLIIEDGECRPTTEFRIRLSKEHAIGATLQKIWKSHSVLIATKIRLMKA